MRWHRTDKASPVALVASGVQHHSTVALFVSLRFMARVLGSGKSDTLRPRRPHIVGQAMPVLASCSQPPESLKTLTRVGSSNR